MYMHVTTQENGNFSQFKEFTLSPDPNNSASLTMHVYWLIFMLAVEE